MFSHRVHLDFMNISFFQASIIQVMLGWMLLCLLMYPMTAELTVKQFFLTVPFWIPIASFIIMLYLQWDLEKRLLSVAKFVEDDVEWANQHMLDSYFLKDYVAEAALQNVVKFLEKRQPPPKLTMGQYITSIVEEAERMFDEGNEPDEDLAFKEARKVSASWSSSYWVHLIINNHSEYLADEEEAAEFHSWFFVYKVFTLALITLFLALCFTTVVTHLYEQGVIPSSILTEWVSLENFLHESGRSGSGRRESTANAVAAMVTTGLHGVQHVQDVLNVLKPLPPDSEHRAVSASGVPTAHPVLQTTRHPDQKAISAPHHLMGTVFGGASKLAGKQNGTTSSMVGKQNSNLVDELRNKLRPWKSQRMQKITF